MASKYNLRVIRILTSLKKKKKKIEVTVGLRPMTPSRPFEKKMRSKGSKGFKDL